MVTAPARLFVTLLVQLILTLPEQVEGAVPVTVIGDKDQLPVSITGPVLLAVMAPPISLPLMIVPFAEEIKIGELNTPP
jgi:hypothetical protein